MPFEIVKPGAYFDFISKWRICVAMSVAVLLASAVGVYVRGIHFGIDFAGGTEMLVRFAKDSKVSEGGIREVLQAQNVKDAAVVRFQDLGGTEFSIRFAGEPGEKGELVDHLAAALRERFGKVDVDRVSFVGPRVGADLRRAGLKALALACALILVYVAFRFTSRYAPGAVIALLHDVLITSGIFVMLGMEFDLQVLAALLAILGYSLNDTIIVYDRIRENMELHTRADLPDVLNRSVSQTLSRTILTSGTTLLAVLALLFLGGEVIRPFALAMTLGIFVGTYSSIYIASPVLLLLERRHEARSHAKSTEKAERGGRSAEKAERGARTAEKAEPGADKTPDESSGKTPGKKSGKGSRKNSSRRARKAGSKAARK